MTLLIATSRLVRITGMSPCTWLENVLKEKLSLLFGYFCIDYIGKVG
jgi:hypothetical protein